MHFVLDYIERAHEAAQSAVHFGSRSFNARHRWDYGGCVFVHCARGVSRSCAFCIAFLMWRNALDYQEALECVPLMGNGVILLYFILDVRMFPLKVQANTFLSTGLSTKYWFCGSANGMVSSTSFVLVFQQ